jgi:hypothetical protein
LAETFKIDIFENLHQVKNGQKDGKAKFVHEIYPSFGHIQTQTAILPLCSFFRYDRYD